MTAKEKKKKQLFHVCWIAQKLFIFHMIVVELVFTKLMHF